MNVSYVFRWILASTALLAFLPGRSAGMDSNYFQQEVHTTLRVTLNDKNHTLSGTVEMEYTNRSPDTLRIIYFHVWPNAYGSNSRLAQQFRDQGLSNLHKAGKEERGFMDSFHFQVDGKEALFRLLTDTADIGQLQLPVPLLPGQSIIISTPFEVKIPTASISRLGHDEQAYYITQWFPKPAVYNRSGWNYFSYLQQGEFFSEWGNYEVYITLPSNYVVAATGILTDTAELQWLEKRSGDTSISSLNFPVSASLQKTLHYHAENVHDFAWFADKRFRVEKGETVLASGKRIQTWSFYTGNQPAYWQHGLEYMDQSLRLFSKWFGDYPYAQATLVDGLAAEGRNMEYPMITLIGKASDLFTYEITVAHEVGHFWFHGMLGSNERNHAWMDEGLANFCETRYVKNKYSPTDTIQDNQSGYFGVFDLLYRSKKYNHRQSQDFLYRSGASLNIDQSPDLPAEKYSQLTYLGDIYYKPVLGFDYLLNLLGDSAFDRCMTTYCEAWKFRHPDPAAMKQSFEQTLGRDLSWLFDEWLTTNDKVDYKLQRADINVEPKDERWASVEISLRNKGRVSAPFRLSGFEEGMERATLLVDGFEGDTVVKLECPGCTEFVIDAGEQLPEVNRQNNSYRVNGFFKKLEPLRFRWMGNSEPVRHTSVFFTPVVGGNKYDGWLTGVALYNLSLQEKPFEYALMPMYGWESKRLAGGGRFMANIHPASGIFSRISLGPGISHYSLDDGYKVDKSLAFTKVSFDVIADFAQQDRREDIREYMELRNIYTATDRQLYSTCPTCTTDDPSVTTDQRYFVFLNYKKEKLRTFHPSSLALSAGLNKHFYRLSFEYNKTLAYTDKGRGFDIRFFAGKVGKAFHNADDVYLDHRLHMSGYDGPDDYLYDGTFIGRSDPESTQFIKADGGFASPTNFGQADWLTGLNFSTIVHPILPVKLYFNMGTYEDAGKTLATTNKLMYELGIELTIFPNVFALYFPLTYSTEIKGEFEANGLSYWDKVRFIFNLQTLNPFVSLKEKMRHGNF